MDLLLVIMTKSLHPRLKTLSLISSGSNFSQVQFRKCIEISLENTYVDIQQGLQGEDGEYYSQCHSQKCLSQGCFPKVRTGRLDCGRISHFGNEKRFFHEFAMKNHLLHTYYLGFDRFCWMILISTGNSIICTDTWHKYHK